METVDFPIPSTDTYNPIVVANGSDDVWFFDMSEGSSRNNLRYWHTTDKFATPVTPNKVCDIAEDPQNNWRMGVIMGANGYPKVSIFKFSDGFSIWSYNPITKIFDSSLVVANSIGSLGRSYAHAEMNGLNHIVFTSGWRGSLVHFYETSEGHFDSTIISTSGLNTYDPQLSVYGEGASARLYIAYLNLDSAICVKGWTLATGWDTDSIVVSGIGHVAIEPALIPQVPSSWGFLPIWYRDLVDNNLYFVKMFQSPSTVKTIDFLAGLTTVVSASKETDALLTLVDTASAHLNKEADADNIDGNIPTHFSLAQNFPNPFNPSTTIAYGLPTNSRVLITVYNIQGQKVSTLVDKQQPAGNYRVEWNGENLNGVELSTGVYFYSLRADGFFKSMKMVLLR